ncbi:angio-associated migratory cell protein [Planococcus citri]|uniref:angio-associated migratory cell protein n=1 Tax=Planococcus citri TaxID=170843 RepID=UPI0031F866EC
MDQPGPANANDDNQELDNRLNEIDIHEVDEDSTDSGEGSIIFVNEDEARVEELVEADDGVVIDDDNSDDMDLGEAEEVNGYINEDRVGGNHPLIRFSGHTGSVFWCDIHPNDNTCAVTGGEDDRAFIWNISTGEVLFECKNHSDSVTHVGFNFDGTYVATGDMKGLIQVWKLFDAEPVWSEKVDELQWLLWHKETNILFAAEKSGAIYIWKIPNGQCKLIPGYGAGTECGMLMPDGKRLVVGYTNRSIRVFDLKAETVIAHYKPQAEIEESATDIDVLADNTNFVAGFTDGVVLVGSTWSSKTLFEVDTKTKVESVRFISHDTAPLIAVGSSNGVDIWDYSKKVLRHSIESSPINRMLYDTTRQMIYAGGVAGEVYVISCLSGSIIYYFVGHRHNILHLEISKDRCKLLSASEDTRSNVYDLTVLDALGCSH